VNNPAAINRFASDLRCELVRATEKVLHPDIRDRYLLAALELSVSDLRAAIETGNRKDIIHARAVEVAAVAGRLAIDGDDLCAPREILADNGKAFLGGRQVKAAGADGRMGN